MNLDLVVSVRRPPGSPHVYRLGDDEIRVGRSAACHVRLPDPAVSGLHLVFRRVEGGFEMLDPGSKHGVQVGRTRLQTGTPRRVAHADIITVGPFTLEVFLEAAAHSTTDHVETHRLANALAMEEALRIRAPWLVSVMEGAHAGEVLTPTADNPVRLNDQGDAIGGGGGDDAVAVTLSIAPDGELLVERRGENGPQTSSLRAGDRLTVGTSVLEVQAGQREDSESAGPSWTPFEVSILVAILLALTATLAAWWGA